MNRIKLDLIKQSTSVPVSQLSEITSCSPYSQGWVSQKFPVYPVVINFHIANPPFNRISLCLKQPYLPGRIVLEGSADSKEYFKFLVLEEFGGASNTVHDLKETHHYKYLRMKVMQPHPVPTQKANSGTNMCKQVWIRCIQLTYITIYGCEYVCSMQKSLQLDPCLFRILELLEYKAVLAQEKAKGKDTKKNEQYRYVSSKYYNDIKDILAKMKQWKENPKKLSQEARQNLLQEIEVLAKEPLQSSYAEDLEYDRDGVRKQVSVLQNQLADFYVHRLNNLHKDVTDYFHKYWNQEVKEQYMRLLSSPEHEDHGKALTNFWSQVKLLKQFPENIEQAVVMYFNYFLEYLHDPLKIMAIKILCLLFRNHALFFQIYFVYQRLLFNLYSQLSNEQNPQLLETSLKCIYTLFQRVPDNLFIQALLNPEHSVKLRMKLVKLEILEKITYKNVAVDARDRDTMMEYILDVLAIKELKLEDKNRAYNVLAYLASLYGKDYVMNKCEKLNTMITMSMEKIIDKKLLMIKREKREEDVPICQHCGTVKQSFRDPNVYDLHCFKECKYLTPCRYCNQVIEIPELPKHYIHTCMERNLFKECEECNEVIIKIKEEDHKKVCTKMLTTKCGLCGQKMEGKLRYKEHLLKDGCPNNPR